MSETQIIKFMVSFFHLTPLVVHTICTHVIMYSFVVGEQIGNSLSLNQVKHIATRNRFLKCHH